jgi:radical SAM protein with 4Fe4S-binding SPASM domain
MSEVAGGKLEHALEPQYVEIEPTMGCNLKCRMCHVAFMKEKLQWLDLDRVGDFSFLRGKTVSIGAVFEPCVHPEINRLIDILNRNDCRIVMITNGHNLHRKEIPALFDSQVEMITFSFDGSSERVYNHIRVGGNYRRTVDNITRFRESFAGKPTAFALNYTVMRYNLEEMLDAVDFWNAKDFDVIRFISMVIREDDLFLRENSLWEVRSQYFDLLDQAAGKVIDTRARICVSSPYYSSPPMREKYAGHEFDGMIKSDHPGARIPRLYTRHFQYGADFGMSFPCKSPFVAARIQWDGSVMLCHNQPVGNLYQKPFREIWNGQRASNLRGRVRRSHSLCEKCDYFRLCIDSHYIDLDNPVNYFSQAMLDRHKPLNVLRRFVKRLKPRLGKLRASFR